MPASSVPRICCRPHLTLNGCISCAQLYYERGTEFDPANANCMGNFASFCFRVKNDVQKANELFTRALKQQPDHVNNLCKYATFLTKSTAKAKEHARKFLQQQEALGLVIPGHSSEASADDEQRQIQDAVEALLTRACALQPTNATALSVCMRRVICSNPMWPLLIIVASGLHTCRTLPTF